MENKNLKRFIKKEDFSVRTYNCLTRYEIKTFGDLASISERELQKAKKLGRKSINEIKEVLSDLGLSLGSVKADKDFFAKDIPNHNGIVCPNCGTKVTGKHQKCPKCFFDVIEYISLKRKAAIDLLKGRNARNRDVILAYIDNKNATYDSVGKQFSISRARVRGILMAYLRKIRRSYREDYYAVFPHDKDDMPELCKNNPKFRELVIKYFNEN